jgi:hypothetical protein
MSTFVVIIGFLVTGALVYGAVMLFVEADARETLMAPLQVAKAPEDEGTHTAGSETFAAAHQEGNRAKSNRSAPCAFS